MQGAAGQGLEWLQVLPDPVFQLQPGHRQLPGSGAMENPLEQVGWQSTTCFLHALLTASVSVCVHVGRLPSGMLWSC